MLTTKPVPVGNICDQLATLAGSHGLKTLAMWLKMAANESYLSQLMTEAQADQRIGVWDWDIANDKREEWTRRLAKRFDNVRSVRTLLAVDLFAADG